MLKELKFVRGAVARKSFIPLMTHFIIKDGTVKAFNGKLALCSPIACDLDCKPKGIPFVKAIQGCTDTMQLHITEAGRVSVRSGSFRALIECSHEELPNIEPTGTYVAIDGELLLKGLKILEPFIGNDASREWTNGVLFDGKSAYATNNVCLVQYWMGIDFPFKVNIPGMVIDEILRIDEEPIAIQADANCITFHYESGRWIRGQLYENQWPDLSRILEKEVNPIPVDPELFVGLKAIKPFADKLNRVYINQQGLRTHLESDDGANYDIADFHFEGVFNIEMLQLLEPIATQYDMSHFPEACLFFGERWRGAIIGMRQ